MDSLAEPKATEYERRSSRRISRGVSIHDGAVQVCGDCGGQEDLVVADGFHPRVGSDSGTSYGEPTTDDATASSSSTTDEAETEPGVEVEAEVEVGAETEAEDTAQTDDEAVDTSPQQSEPEASPDTAESLQPPVVRDRPRSIAKPPEPADSFALRHDGAISLTPEATAVVDRNSHPSSSPGSEPATPSGPSFPYDVYAQAVGLARAMSPATINTMTAPASPISEYPPTPTSPLGPSHPYGMYPQSTAAGPSSMPLHGPVGFQGMPDNYQRRVGPDGEVLSDMIGPDGHTEQLPPYSRYPDEASVRKARDVAASSASALAGPSSNPSLNPILNSLSNLNPNQNPNDTPEQPQSPVSATFPSTVPSDTASPAVAPASSTTTPVDEVAATSEPSAGGIGLATRNSEFDSDNGRDSSRSQHSSRSFTSESENSGQRLNRGGNGSAGSAGSDEQQDKEAVSEKNSADKKTRRKKWQLYARRRLWGIVPYWAICFFVALVVIIGIVAGAVVGTFLEQKNRKPPPRPPAKHGGYSGTVSGPPIVSVTVDASPIPTPTDLPPLATGSYSLPLGLNKSPASCFNDSTQSPSWSCGIWFGSGMTISVEQVNGSPKLSRRGQSTVPGYSVALSGDQTRVTGNTFWYGQQPPSIPSPLPMELVSDISDPEKKAAWFKMVPYDKTVIVQESMLTTRASGGGGAPAATPTAALLEDAEKRRRGKLVRAYGGPPGDFHRKGMAGVGDKPWVCTWPDTLIEVFIYPHQNNSAWTRYSQSASSTSSIPSATPEPSSSPALSSSYSQTTPTSSAAGAGQSPTPSSSSNSTSNSGGPPWSSGSWIPPYPRVVKVVERRMARARQAYCRQYEVKPEGSSQPVLDQNGDFVEFNISEEETGPAMVYSDGTESSAQRRWAEEEDGQGSSENMRLQSRAFGPDLSDCGCLWMLT